MGTLGQLLRNARETRGIDLHDAAQQTRISINFLKALEEEDFSRLPGEIFVKGFLKNYGKFLRLDESEVMRKYAELVSPRSAPIAVANNEQADTGGERNESKRTGIEPFLWGAGILIALIVFLFTTMPEKRAIETHQAETPESTSQTVTAPVAQQDKLYLEVIALENTWLLVRTDNSPQKKAMLTKGENLIWSADERFLLSYGSARAVKLMLNGQELAVNEPGNAVVRDLTITASGIVSRQAPSEFERPARLKKKPVLEQQSSATGTPVQEQQSAPVHEQAFPPAVSPVPATQPDQPNPQQQ